MLMIMLHIRCVSRNVSTLFVNSTDTSSHRFYRATAYMLSALHAIARPSIWPSVCQMCVS